MKGIRMDGQSNACIQTKGDGNCLFHAMAASNKLNINDTLILRANIYGKIIEWTSKPSKMMVAINAVYEMLQDNRLSLQDFINCQKQSGQWGSTLDMVFAALVFNINILSISNLPKKFEIFSTSDFLATLKLDHFIEGCVETIYIHHHMFGNPFYPSLNPNHFCALMLIDDEKIDYSIQLYERHDSSLDYNKSTLDLGKNIRKSPIRKKAKCHMRQTKIGFYIDISKAAKNGSTTKLKEKEHRKAALSNWVIFGTEAERLKLIQMQEKNLKRSEFESEIEEKCGNAEQDNHCASAIQCVKTKSQEEISWNEHAQRIYFYLYPELANKRMSMLRWAYPSLLENTFKNWLKRHDMVSKWITIIKHLKGGDVIQNIENDAAKERLLSFFSGRTSVNVDRYAKRVEKNPKVVLVASELKMVTMLVSKAYKQDNHVYMKKTANRLNQAEKTKNLKYQDAHEFVWKLVQERWKSGQPITKSEVRVQCMKKFTQGDFFENVLDKGGNTNHFYVFLKRSLQLINFTDRKATISQQIPIDWKDQAHEGAA